MDEGRAPGERVADIAIPQLDGEGSEGGNEDQQLPSMSQDQLKLPQEMHVYTCDVTCYCNFCRTSWYKCFDVKSLSIVRDFVFCWTLPGTFM